MPTYEYKCNDCGEHFDLFISIRQKEKELDLTCPNCGSKNVKEVFSNFIYVDKSEYLPRCQWQQMLLWWRGLRNVRYNHYI